MLKQIPCTYSGNIFKALPTSRSAKHVCVTNLSANGTRDSSVGEILWP